jgi:uncharacterized protein YjeT (DUF2065 family)
VAWNDLLVALALVCVIEGVMPFVNPGRTRRLLARLATLEDRQMRVMAFVSMMIGMAILFAVRS